VEGQPVAEALEPGKSKSSLNDQVRVFGAFLIYGGGDGGDIVWARCGEVLELKRKEGKGKRK
jgi:hypothetical protein